MDSGESHNDLTIVSGKGPVKPSSLRDVGDQVMGNAKGIMKRHFQFFLYVICF